MTNEQPPQNPTGPETPSPGPQPGEQDAPRGQREYESPKTGQTFWDPDDYPMTTAERERRRREESEEREQQYRAEALAREQAADARAEAQVEATNRVTHQVAAEGAATRQMVGDAAVVGEVGDRARHTETMQGIVGIIGELQQGRIEHDAAVQQILAAIVGSGNNINDALRRVEQVSGRGAVQTHALLAEISAKLEGRMQSPYGAPQPSMTRSQLPLGLGTAKAAKAGLHESYRAEIQPVGKQGQYQPISAHGLTSQRAANHLNYLGQRGRRRRLSALPRAYGYRIADARQDAERVVSGGNQEVAQDPRALGLLAHKEARRIRNMRLPGRLAAGMRHRLLVQPSHMVRIGIYKPLNAVTAAERSRHIGRGTSTLASPNAHRLSSRAVQRRYDAVEALRPDKPREPGTPPAREPFRHVEGRERAGLTLSKRIASHISNVLARSETELVLSRDVLHRVQAGRERLPSRSAQERYGHDPDEWS